MSEAEFREEVSRLEFSKMSKKYVAQVIPSVSQSGQSEMYDVFVWRKSNHERGAGLFLLQWIRRGNPETPKLKKEIDLKAIAEFGGNLAYFNCGFGRGNDLGITDVDNLMKVIHTLKNLGIIIKL